MRKEEKGHNKIKMITLNNNDNSNKNIHINISYNLTDPKNALDIIHESSNGSNKFTNQNTNASDNSFIKCKKIDNKQVVIERDLHKYSYPTSVRKNLIEDINQSLDNQCEISIKLVNKKLQLGNNVFKELLKPKPKRNKKCITNPNSLNNTIKLNKKQESYRDKSVINALSKMLFKEKSKAKSEEVIKIKLHNRNKLQLEEKIKNLELLAKKKQKTETVTLKKKQSKRVPFAKERIPDNKANKSKEKLKKYLKKSKDNIESEILQRYFKISQLSDNVHKSEYENKQENYIIAPLVNIDRIKELQTTAATIIQKAWRSYKSRQVLSFYNQIFSKNQPKNNHSQNIFLNPSFDEIIQQEMLKEESDYSLESEMARLPRNPDKSIEQEHKGDFEYKNFQKIKQFLRLNHKNTSSGNVEEEDSQFNIHKYQELLEPFSMTSEKNETEISEPEKVRLVDEKIEKKISDRNPEQQILKFKQTQMKRWSKMEEFIRSQLDNEFNLDPTDLLKILKEQSEHNKKILETGVFSMGRQDTKESKSRSSLKSQNYRSLIEEKGIGDKIFGDKNSTVVKTIFDGENLIQKKKSHKSSHSDNERVEELFPELLEVKDDSNAIKNIRIEDYLDCGLTSFQFEGQKSKEDAMKSDEYRLLLMKSTKVDNQIDSYQEVVRIKNFSLEQQLSVFQLVYKSVIEQTVLELNTKMETCLKAYKQDSVNQRLVRQQRTTGAINTSVGSIKEYLNRFIQFILSDDQHKKDVVRHINCILGPSSKEMLYYLRVNNEEYSHQQSFTDDEAYLFVASLNMFEKFEQSLFSSQQPMDGKAKTYTHYWHRAIFQSYNEALDLERPFGVLGRPYVWQVVPRLYHSAITGSKIGVHLVAAMNRIIEMAQCPAGIIFDKKDCPYYNSSLSEQQQRKINNDRTSLILAEELIENEQAIINYHDQVSEIKLELSHVISEKILFDLVTELRKLALNRL